MSGCYVQPGNAKQLGHSGTSYHETVQELKEEAEQLGFL